MKRREVLVGAVALVLMVLSLFDYSRETRRTTAQGGTSVETVNFDGASLVSIGLGVAVLFSASALSRGLTRISDRMSLPKALPPVPYEWLPLALAPFLVIATAKTITMPVENGTVAITSGFGNSASKVWMLILLCALVYLAKLRARLKDIAGRV